MSRKAKYQHLLEKSIHAALSAIEIYNKPDFKYREETFSILMVNAWELLLKAQILKANRNQLNSIYIIDPKKIKKNGAPYKKSKYKTSRSGNFMTIDITNAMKSLSLDERLKANLNALIEIRDNAIHLMNDGKLLKKKILEIGTASLKSYILMTNTWFNHNLNQYNFYLMPMSFFHNHEMQSFSIHSEGKQHQNLLEFIDTQEAKFPSDETQEHNISLTLETKFVRSESNSALSVKHNPDDPTAISYTVNSEEAFQKKYSWSWKNNLLPKLQSLYTNFKMDNNFGQ